MSICVLVKPSFAPLVAGGAKNAAGEAGQLVRQHPLLDPHQPIKKMLAYNPYALAVLACGKMLA